tara:strand:+ start:4649 stop:5461 length:813 start_codon:yes stop_codon:yes gene_type:complete
MKKIAYLILPLFTFVFFACEDKQAEVYSGESITYFTQTTATYPVEAGSAFEVGIVVSDASSSPRGFVVEVDQDLTTALPNSYSMDMNPSIDADSYTASFNVYGEVTNVVAGQVLVLNLVAVEGSNLAGFDTTISITMNPSCPIEADFTGDYLIEEITPYVDGPTLADGSIVTVSPVTGNATQRTFNSANYPNYCSTPNAFTFELNCGQILMAGEGTQCNCSCGGNLWFTNAAEPTSYDPADDSMFEVSFTNDAYSDCGAPQTTTYRFTKQ